MKLPRSIVKKYGISKKAWSVYRNSRSRSTRAAKVTTVARKRTFRSRARSVGRALRTRGGRRRIGGSLTSGWMPLSMHESFVAFGVGMTAGKLNQFVAPYTDGILEPLGPYKDEARTALIGAVLYKMGSGVIKEAGREYFRLALMSAGAQTSGQVFGTASQGVNSLYQFN